jgi:hypothetical protein
MHAYVLEVSRRRPTHLMHRRRQSPRKRKKEQLLERQRQPTLIPLARLSADGVSTLGHVLHAAASGGLPLLLTSAIHGR